MKTFELGDVNSLFNTRNELVKALLSALYIEALR
jgi:hypothetical protein